MERRLAVVVIIIALATAVASCGSIPVPAGGPQHGGSTSAPAAYPAQIDGTIVSFQPGDPSYVTLSDVTSMKSSADGGQRQTMSTRKIKLPAGSMVSPGHWQAKGDTLDLFKGDDFTLLTHSGHIMDTTMGDPTYGVVLSTSKDKMTVRLIRPASGSHAMRFSGKTATIHFAPYTRVFPGGSEPQEGTGYIHPGDALIMVIIGPSSDYIATQLTDFRSPAAAGWKLQGR